MLIYEVLKIRDFSKLLRLLFATQKNSSATHFGVVTHRLGTTGLAIPKAWLKR